jgi:hypothetical protein
MKMTRRIVTSSFFTIEKSPELISIWILLKKRGNLKKLNFLEGVKGRQPHLVFKK